MLGLIYDMAKMHSEINQIKWREKGSMWKIIDLPTKYHSTYNVQSVTLFCNLLQNDNMYKPYINFMQLISPLPVPWRGL